jgi:stage IV sporulation protein A
MVDGAVGQMEGEFPRMVTTPWYDHEIPMTEAAELGTRKVIAEHSTIGIVVTTDGTITDIPREDYLDAEERVIGELKELGKPFLVLLNTAQPESERANALCADIARRYDVACKAVNCLELDRDTISGIISDVLYEFPVKELDFFLPAWVDALEADHPIKTEVYSTIRDSAQGIGRIRDVHTVAQRIGDCEQVSGAGITSVDLGSGVAAITLELPRSLFYQTLSQQSGFDIHDDGELLNQLTSLSRIKAEYDRVAEALRQVEETGYGIVVPRPEAMVLEEPEIVRQGGRYGVRLRASAPSIHMMRADIQTEVAPIVGTEKQSEEMINYLLQEFEGDTDKIWQSNIFGKSFYELVGEDLNTKLKRMPEDARNKLRETLQRIINEGSGGLICIIL